MPTLLEGASERLAVFAFREMRVAVGVKIAG